MALCDQMKLRGKRGSNARSADRRRALARLNEPDPNFQETPLRARRHGGHHSAPRSDKQLRQTILRPAVRGKLVPRTRGRTSGRVLERMTAAERAMRKRATDDA